MVQELKLKLKLELKRRKGVVKRESKTGLFWCRKDVFSKRWEEVERDRKEGVSG